MGTQLRYAAPDRHIKRPDPRWKPLDSKDCYNATCATPHYVRAWENTMKGQGPDMLGKLIPIPGMDLQAKHKKLDWVTKKKHAALPATMTIGSAKCWACTASQVIVPPAPKRSAMTV